MTEKKILGQAARILVDATNEIWHKISLWTHASDVEMPDGTALTTYLSDTKDEIDTKFDQKYNSYNMETKTIIDLSEIPELGYSRMVTGRAITAGDYTIPLNHYLYGYSGKDPESIEKMAVLIDTTDLTSIVMYIAHYNIEAKWTLTKIATQKQIDDLQQQINELNNNFNILNLFVQSSIGDLNAQYNHIQAQMDWLEAELAELQEQLNDLLNELRDFKAATNARLDKLEWWFNQMYGPIGSIFITHSDVSPHDLFGGEWYLVQDAYLYGGVDGASTIQYRDRGSDWVDPNGANYINRYDFSPMYEGRQSFQLNVQNLPPHWHGFGELNNDKDRALHIRLKDENDWNPQWLETTINVGAGDSPLTIVNITNDAKNRMEVSSLGGYMWLWNGTQANDKDGSMQREPVMLDPIRFKARIWMRIG